MAGTTQFTIRTGITIGDLAITTASNTVTEATPVVPQTAETRAAAAQAVRPRVAAGIISHLPLYQVIRAGRRATGSEASRGALQSREALLDLAGRKLPSNFRLKSAEPDPSRSLGALYFVRVVSISF